MLNFYQVSGCLAPACQSYIRRQADVDFYEGLKKGEFCSVLSPPQTGKSSLLVQTMMRLQAFGVACVAIDLTKFSSPKFTPQQWYGLLIKSLWSDFHLEEKVDFNWWWQQHSNLSPVEKFGEFLDKILLKLLTKNLVIFIDGIEQIYRLQFPTDDFFGLIFHCYKNRSHSSDYQRLNFAILGVATPETLLSNHKKSPFQIGKAIELTGLQLHRSYPLAKPLNSRAANPLNTLKEIFNWTEGQPFLTQYLCQLVLQSSEFIPEGQEKAALLKLVTLQLFKKQSQETHRHLQKIYLSLKNSNNYQELLQIYENIFLQKGIPLDDNNQLIQELSISGLIRCQGDKYKIANPIYRSFFSIKWLEKEVIKTSPPPATKVNDASAAHQSLPLSSLKTQYSQTLTHQSLEKTQQNSTTKNLNQINNWELDSQIIYNYLIEAVKKEFPEQVLYRFEQLFIEGESPDTEIQAALQRLVKTSDNQQEYRYLLNRCCHILINHWQSQTRTQKAIGDLVNLFDTEPVQLSRVIASFDLRKRLYQLIQDFKKSDEYLTLNKLVQVVLEPASGSGQTVKPALGELICRYPYLYSHCLLTPESPTEQQQIIQTISQRRQWQLEVNLSRYAAELSRRSQKLAQPMVNSLNTQNPTLLTEPELCLALRQYSGKVQGAYTYQDLAKVFLNHSSETKFFSDFKTDLYEYIISSVEPAYGKRQFNSRLYKFLVKDTFAECDTRKLTDFLLVRTCCQLFNFLVVENSQSPNHFIFIDLIANLGPVSTIGLLLKIVLLSRTVKSHLEKRFSILFNHYEQLEVSEILWLVKSLENLNVAFSINFGNVDVSFLKT